MLEYSACRNAELEAHAERTLTFLLLLNIIQEICFRVIERGFSWK